MSKFKISGILFLPLSILAFSTAFARASKPRELYNDGNYEKTIEDIGNFQSPASGALVFQGKFALYQDARAGRAICVPPASNPAAVLSRNGITTGGKVSSAEQAALAKGVAQVERLLGHPLPQAWRTRYNFISATGAWNQSANGINVRRIPGSATGLLTGRMMHELGHKVGNTGVYSKYRQATGGKICGITPYASRGSKKTVSRANEEFAEVFEAYVAFPDLLKAQCPKSYDYFAKSLFPNSSGYMATCKNGISGNSNSRDESRSEQSGSTSPRNKSKSGAQ